MSSNIAPPHWREAIQKALDIVGGPTSLMRKLNERGFEISTHNVIGQWVKNGVPAKYCPDLEDLTGVTCEDLCPDVKWGLVRDRRAASKAAV